MATPATLATGMTLPVIAAPLFIISNPDLVIAQCKAGVIGSFPALNARPLAMLDEWLHRITEELDSYSRNHPHAPAAKFAVNQIVHKSNTRLDKDLELCVKYKVPLVITSLGARREVNEAVHSYGGMVMHDVINQPYAHKAMEKGADGLILVAAGAGGHAGAQSPFAIVQETRQWFDGPLALSGAIARGAAILAAQILGADFAYIGSAFIATTEANADARYKQAILDGAAGDIVYSNFFTGVHGNYLRGSVLAAGLDPDQLPQKDPSIMNFGSAATNAPAAKAWRDIWGAGQGIGTITQIQPAAEFVAQLIEEYRSAAARSPLAVPVAFRPAVAAAV
jgi:nitronate monooxygenase